MLRRMMGIKRIEKIRNEEIRVREGAANISEKIGDARQMFRTCRQKDRGRCSNESMEIKVI